MATEGICEYTLAPGNGFSGVNEMSRDALVMDHLSMVGLVVRRVAQKLPPSVDHEDVRSAGVLGLMDAAQKYDPRRGVKFRTYAEVRIHGAIVDYLRSLSWAPRGMHRRARDIEAARSAVEQRTCGAATASDLARELRMTVEEYHRVQMQVHALDVQEEGEMFRELETSRELSVCTADKADPLSDLERKVTLEVVQRAIEILPERQRLVLWLYYYEELTMKEVGSVLEVNEARVSQIHARAIANLRREVDQHLLYPETAGAHPQNQARRGAEARPPE